MAILQRKEGFDDNHGPLRLAIMFMGSDGIADYDAIFGNGYGKNLFGLLLQDHGFGGNYNRFGTGGLMERIAIRSNVFPKFILAPLDNPFTETTAWNGYTRIEGLNCSMGGMHDNLRFLWEGRK